MFMRKAPDLHIQSWVNTEVPLTLENLYGRVIVIHAFQMLCHGCVNYAIPQTSRLYQYFTRSDDVAVIGLHSVFENHTEMKPEALKTFIQENKIAFPIGIDTPREGKSIPMTMAAYNMQGTPTLILIDRKGNLRLQHFGIVDDLYLGLAIGSLIAEPKD